VKLFNAVISSIICNSNARRKNDEYYCNRNLINR